MYVFALHSAMWYFFVNFAIEYYFLNKIIFKSTFVESHITLISLQASWHIFINSVLNNKCFVALSLKLSLKLYNTLTNTIIVKFSI